MIFNLYSRVLVKLGDEQHIFDRKRLMYTEVAEIEKVTGQSYAEWEQGLGKYSITAVAALLHILRKRDGTPSDFKTMQFNAAELDVVPLHDDDTEFTAGEVAEDLAKRSQEAEAGPGPTPAADGSGKGSEPDTTITSLSSRNSSESARGNGTSSPGRTSVSSGRARTPAAAANG